MKIIPITHGNVYDVDTHLHHKHKKEKLWKSLQMSRINCGQSQLTFLEVQYVIKHLQPVKWGPLTLSEWHLQPPVNSGRTTWTITKIYIFLEFLISKLFHCLPYIFYKVVPLVPLYHKNGECQLNRNLCFQKCFLKWKDYGC